MTTPPTQYISADNIKTAEALLKEHGSRAAVIAGGTDLLGTLKDAVHVEPPQMLIGLKLVTDLSYIAAEPAGVRIGALTTLAALVKDPVIRKTVPLLAQAAGSVASPQIRNVATIAGNLCQEPRCWYYRNPENGFDCLRKGGKWCDAIFAENRYHSIFGGMRVNASPCTTGCPIHNEIPAYMAKLRGGKVAEAVKILMDTNPLAAITGRVCAHACEESCNRCDFDESVSIRNVERYLGDYALAHAETFYPAPQTESGQSVAVVGSGPAGLVAAYFLRQQGHAVTVYERMPLAGGMLNYSIPAYRLPKAVVQAQVKALEGMGIHFELDTQVGASGISLQKLCERYQSVFLATGLWKGNSLRLEKEYLLDSGLEFLIGIQTGTARPVGKRVLVIGGGSVAVDVAISARRLGAEQVTMVCLESLEIMPALAEDIVQAHEEGITIMPSLGPQRVLEQGGKLSGMEFARCVSVFDEHGRFAPTFDIEAKTLIEADQVLVAIGQSADLAFAGSMVNTERGKIMVDKVSALTNIAGVFAGGDVTGGAATVVQAMAEGKKAASGIQAYLAATQLTGALPSSGTIPLVVNQTALAATSGAVSPQAPVTWRTIGGEDVQTLPFDEISGEAFRCANCGCVAVNSSDVATALVALDARIKTTQRTLAAEELFAAAENRSTVLAEDELIEEIWVPSPKSETYQCYLKFRTRNAIDFPIVGVAFRAERSDGRFHEVRLVLGAVAPILRRAYAVENFLEGKMLSEGLADEAAALAIADAQPLARNKAKVEIVRALVKRAIQSAG